jgi:hypothetical protein
MAHRNTDCVGWLIPESGNRFAALQSIAMGLTEISGWVEPEVAGDLAVRLDHGSHYPYRTGHL